MFCAYLRCKVSMLSRTVEWDAFSVEGCRTTEVHIGIGGIFYSNSASCQSIGCDQGEGTGGGWKRTHAAANLSHCSPGHQHTSSSTTLNCSK